MLFIIFPIPFLFLWIVVLDFNHVYGRKVDVTDENFHGRRKQIESDFFCPIFFTLFFTDGIGFSFFTTSHIIGFDFFARFFRLYFTDGRQKHF